MAAADAIHSSWPSGALVVIATRAAPSIDALRRDIKIHGMDQRRQFWPKFRHALHQRDLRLFHARMPGLPARANPRRATVESGEQPIA